MPDNDKVLDKRRLDWLDEQCGQGLISDDAGRWAVDSGGVQNLPDSDCAIDIAVTFFVQAADWRPTVREAIDAAMEKERKELEEATNA